MIRKAYKYRIYPNKEQREYFAKVFGCVRFFYNKSLSDMCEIYKSAGKNENITPARYKKDHPFLKEVDSLALCNAQLARNAAFKSFYRKQNGFPKYKSKRNDQAIHLISVGRLVPQKGYDRLLKAVKRLHDKGYSFQLTILGDGIERDMLEEYINGNDMHSYVSLPGFVDNPYQEMAASDIFVCSSRAEGFSLVIAEAMALGIPVISTYCSGPNELLQKGKCGMLVDNSENGIYHGLENVLLNKEQMADCIEAAREKIFGFSPTIIINQIEALLDD